MKIKELYEEFEFTSKDISKITILDKITPKIVIIKFKNGIEKRIYYDKIPKFIYKIKNGEL